MVSLKKVYELFLMSPKDLFLCKGDDFETYCFNCKKCEKELIEYWRRYLYYEDSMRCFGQYKEGRSCNLCQNTNYTLNSLCKKDSKVWHRVSISLSSTGGFSGRSGSLFISSGEDYEKIKNSLKRGTIETS